MRYTAALGGPMRSMTNRANLVALACASVLTMAIKIPVYLFFYFLFSYVMVEALRALFSLPGRRS